MKYKILFFIVLLMTNHAMAQEDDIQPYYYHTVADGHYDIVVVDYNTGETLHTITTDDYDCANTFSPDNRYLHYSSGGGRNFPTGQGYLLDLQTGESLEIPDMQYVGVWSPDSTQLAFETTIEIGMNLLIVYDLATGISTEIGLIDWDGYAIWQADTLIYATHDENQLTVNQWENQELTPLITDYDLPDSPFYTMKFSPDARYLVIGSQVDDAKQYDLLDIMTGNVQQLDISPVDSRIVWDSDSTSFVYLDRGLKQYNVASGAVTHLASPYDVLRSETLEWSPDNRYLSFNQTRNYGMPDVFGWVNYYDFETGEIEYVRATTNFISGDIRWLSDTKFIYTESDDLKEYSAEANNLNELVLYDITIDEHTILTDTLELDEQIFCRLG